MFDSPWGQPAPQPSEEPQDAPQPQEAVPAEPAPEPQAEPEEKPKPARKPRPRPKKEPGRITARQVTQVLDVVEALKDPRVRAVAAAVSGKEDDADLVVAAVTGALSAPIGALLDGLEAKGSRRAGAIMKAGEKSPKTLSDAADVLEAWDREAIEAASMDDPRPGRGNEIDLAFWLAARLDDVDGLESLAVLR